MSGVSVKVVRLPHGADIPLPAYQSDQAAGLDLCAAVPSDAPVVIPAGGWTGIPTGLALALPPGTEAQVRPRSGLAAKSAVTVLNAPGTIDADYRGEVKVLLINHGPTPFTVERGSRIAQLVVAPVTQAEWAEVDTLDDTARGDGGFGSTGTHAVTSK